MRITTESIVWRDLEIGLSSVAGAQTGGTFRDRQLGEFGGSALTLAVTLSLVALSGAFNGVSQLLSIVALAMGVFGILLGAVSWLKPRRGLHMRTKTGDELWLRLEGFSRQEMRSVAKALKAARGARN